jgi:transcription termination factor Rho
MARRRRPRQNRDRDDRAEGASNDDRGGREPPDRRGGDDREPGGDRRSHGGERDGGGRQKEGRRRSRNSAGRRGDGGSRSGEPVKGILNVQREGHGYLRDPKASLGSTSRDIFVPAQLIRRYHLRAGLEISGQAATGGGKRRPLLSVESVDGLAPEKYRGVPEFTRLVSEDPRRRINLEMPDGDMTLRMIDLVTPIGFGQRALIVAPPRTGKTTILHKLTRAIVHNHPEALVLVVLVDERPEEVTDFTRSCAGAQVLASSLDKDSTVHVALCEMVLERARRLLELGRDVVILFDSLTRMARAFNTERGRSGRTLSGGLDAQAMQKPREFFGAARATEEGSLTIIATALVDTGSRLDEVIFQEFKGTGNMELVLTRKLSDYRVFPAIDVRESATRKEEKLRTHDELQRVNSLRRLLLRGKPKGALEGLLKQMSKTQSNGEFLMGLPA